MDRDEIEGLKASVPIRVVADCLGLHGRGTRLWCPGCQPSGAHGHRTPDLALYEQGFKCFRCGESGDQLGLVQLTLRCTFPEALSWLQSRSGANPTTNGDRLRYQPMVNGQRHQLSKGALAPGLPAPLLYGPSPPPPTPKAWNQEFLAMVSALPGSLGQAYIEARGFTLGQLKGLVGYASGKDWPGRSWRLGRVVFPHSRPDLPGAIVNLYGRAVEFSGRECPKHLRHDHMVGSKGFWMPRAMAEFDTVFVAEGSFDAAAIHVSSPDQVAVAIFGLAGLRWEWLPRRVVFALDHDPAGEKAFRELALEGLLRGKEILRLPAAVYGGEKDLAAAWAKFGTLDF